MSSSAPNIWLTESAGRLIIAAYLDCIVPGCSQKTASESSYCGQHRREHAELQEQLARERAVAQAVADFKERLRDRIRATQTLTELQEVLCDLVDLIVE